MILFQCYVTLFMFYALLAFILDGHKGRSAYLSSLLILILAMPGITYLIKS
jgi:hypothetical protein